MSQQGCHDKVLILLTSWVFLADVRHPDALCSVSVCVCVGFCGGFLVGFLFFFGRFCYGFFRFKILCCLDYTSQLC